LSTGDNIVTVNGDDDGPKLLPNNVTFATVPFAYEPNVGNTNAPLRLLMTGGKYPNDDEYTTGDCNPTVNTNCRPWP